MWIHPFVDGNGRTARLALDGAFASMKMSGYGLWNISQGLAKNSDEYKKYLAHADMPKQGEKIFKYLLLSGECVRGKIPEIIGMKERTASRVISELLKRNFIVS